MPGHWLLAVEFLAKAVPSPLATSVVLTAVSRLDRAKRLDAAQGLTQLRGRDVTNRQRAQPRKDVLLQADVPSDSSFSFPA